MSQQKDQPLTDEIESMLQMIIDKTLRSASQQKGHKLMNETEHTPQIIIKKTKDGRGRARQDHLVLCNVAWHVKSCRNRQHKGVIDVWLHHMKNTEPSSKD
jgi:hypothetical protein